MQSLSSIRLLLPLFLGAFTAAAWSQTRPTAKPEGATFVTTQVVELQADGGIGPVGNQTTILYDTNAAGEWSDERAAVYEAPITLTATTVLRAKAIYQLGDPSDVATFRYTKDRPPVVSLTRPLNGDFLRSGTAYTLNASASDPDNEAVTVSYQYQMGATTTWHPIGSPATAAPFAVSWTPGDPSAYRLRAVATDPHGAVTHSAAINVTVTEANLAPDVRLIRPQNGATVRLDNSVVLEATAEDQDLQGGRITRVDFFANNSLIGSDSTAPYNYTWTPAQEGTYSLQAKGFDNHTPAAMGASNSADLIVQPRNGAPVVTLAANPPGPLNFPGATTLSSNVTDDGTVLAVAFFQVGAIGAATFLARDSVAPYSLSLSGLPSGTRTYFARAYDDAGDSAMSPNVEVTVRDNQPPIARNSKDTLQLVLPGTTTAALNASSSTDPEGSALTFQWSATAGVSFSSATTAAPTATFTRAGDHVITLVVTDAAGLKDTAFVNATAWAAPAITGKLQDTATVGAVYNYTMAATGHNPPSFSQPASKPAWLNYLTGGRLQGTPPAGSGGTALIDINAGNNISTTSRQLSLYVREAPRITADIPESLYVVREGRQVALQVSAAGFPLPTYQWERLQANGPSPVGTNSNRYAIESALLSQSGLYRVRVHNGVGAAVYSRTVRIDVKAMLRLSTRPLATTQQVGRRAVFHAGATGAGPIRYQWFRGNVSVIGPAVKDSTLFLDPVKLADAGLYRARITSPYADTLWTDTVRLTVLQPKVDRPKSTPAAPHEYQSDSLVVTLSTDTPSTTIRYTLDGANPTATSPLVYDPSTKLVLRKASVTLKARGFRENFTESDVFSGEYRYLPATQAGKPTATPAKANFQIAMTCTLSNSTPGSTIHYTLDGTNPKTSPKFPYTGPFPLSATTTVTAYATAAGFTESDTLVKTYTLDRVEYQAQAPIADPPGTTFTEAVDVNLSSGTDSVTIHYTTDGSSPALDGPGRNSFVRGSPLRFTQTTHLQAQAVRTGFLPSPVVSHHYIRIPGPITANPAPTGGNLIFEDSLQVFLRVAPAGAPLWYTLNDSVPLDAKGRVINQAEKYDTAAGIWLKGTHTITAMAAMDTVPSKVFRFSYTRRGGTLNTPQVATSTNSYSFKDSLRFTLSTLAGAEIRYTLDGSLPGSASRLYDRAVTIDSSTTLQAIAFHKDFLPSRILVAGFTLEADTPRVSVAAGSYFSAQNVLITTVSAKTPVKYTLDGSVPGPDHGIDYVKGQPIRISSHTDLKAVAFAGGVPGPVREASYRIFSAKDTVLPAGETYLLEGGYSIANPFGEGVPVRVVQGAADSLNLPGFGSVEFSLTITPFTQPGGGPGEFPTLILARGSAESRGFYKMMEGGKIYFLSGADRIPISEPGTYFMGVDVQPPVITYEGEDIDDSGFTNVRFLVEDNVHNMVYDLKRSDAPDSKVSRKEVFAGNQLPFRLRNAAKELAALGIQLSVNDFNNRTTFPPDGISYFPLSQGLASATGPETWKVGATPAEPYDLVGIPLDMVPPMTLAELGDARTGQVEGFIFNHAKNGFDRVAQGDKLKPGQAYWLATRSPLKGFRRARPFRTAALGGLRKFSVVLKTGWNQVANPHLEKLYWPVSHTQREFYRSSLIKGLWNYSPSETRKYFESDVLEPWRGYFVYNYGPETTVDLLNAPPDRLVRKKEGAGEYEATLELAYGDAAAVRLGASPLSRDEVGLDDEAALPALSDRSRFAAVRQGRGLAADWIRFEHGRILAWRVLPGHGGGEALPAIRLLARDLPDGYEVWAVSPARGMKFRMDPGQSLPASGLPGDTLDILAGPAAKLARHPRLHGLSETAPELDLRVRRTPGGPEILLDLPELSSVRAWFFDLRGARLGEMGRRLPAGRYRFDYARDFRHAVARPSPGVHFLRVEIRSGGKSVWLTRKTLLRD